MQTWSDGYIIDLPYIRSFFQEQSPIHLNLICSLANISPPDLEQGFDYCELGCGQGLTAILLAAAFPRGRFYAVDFNPAHISQARKTAREAGINNLTFLDASFEEILTFEDLPRFNYITLHGIYSWISRAQQRNIIGFIRNFLKAGGVVYNSYNAKPGKAGLEPVHRVFRELTPAGAPPLDRVRTGLNLLEKMAAHPGWSHGQPALKQQILNLGTKSPHYLAHEFLNDHWRPEYCTDVFRDMAEAKLTYAGSADLVKNFEALALPAAFLEQYRAIPTRESRELFHDLVQNTHFRKDVYIRGPIPMSRAQRLKVNSGILLARSPFHPQFASTYTCGAGQVDMTKESAAPLIYDRLSREAVPMATLLNATPGIEPARVMDSLRHLLAGGQVCPVAGSQTAATGLNRINQLLLDRAAEELQGAWLSSGYLGNAFFLPLIQVLMLNTHLKEVDSGKEVPRMVAETLATAGASFTLADKKITAPDEMAGHIDGLYKEFPKTLAELERLGVL